MLAVALAWAVPFLLSAIEGHAVGPASEGPFVLDLVAWARFFLAVGAFILAEQMTEESHVRILRQFEQAPVIAPSSIDAAYQIVRNACHMRDSRLAELVSLGLAIIASVASYFNFREALIGSWAVELTADGQGRLTLAAWWCLLISSPIFWFLLFRSLWRQMIWSWLLKDLAGLELRLVSNHPDGHGGIGFVGQFPNAYSLFVFGISCVIGAALAHLMLLQTINLTAYATVMGTWLLIILALFAYPLTAFSVPLAKLKVRSLAATSTAATRFFRASERKVLGANIAAPDESEAAGQGDVQDPSKQFDATRKLSRWLVDRSTLVPVAASALLPLIAAGATHLPYKELLGVAKKLLLL